MSVAVKPGDAVKRGQVLLILEAMKMQNEIMAPGDGKVADVWVAAGEKLQAKSLVAVTSAKTVTITGRARLYA